MPQQQPPMPPEGAPQESTGNQVVEGMQKVRDFMGQLAQLQKVLPPEAMKALGVATQAYDQFMQMALGQLGEQPQQAPQDAMAAGPRQSMPADQPTRPGARPA